MQEGVDDGVVVGGLFGLTLRDTKRVGGDQTTHLGDVRLDIGDHDALGKRVLADLANAGDFTTGGADASSGGERLDDGKEVLLRLIAALQLDAGLNEVGLERFDVVQAIDADGVGVFGEVDALALGAGSGFLDLGEIFAQKERAFDHAGGEDVGGMKDISVGVLHG